MGFPSSNSKLVVECRDEKKDGGSKADEGNDEVRTNVPCVKDLLRAFSGPEENKNAGGGAGASKRVDQEQSPRWREYPPQIDMYAAEKNLAVYVSEEKKEDDHSCVGSWKQPHTPKSSIPQPLTTNTEKPGARRTSPSSLGAVLSPLPPASFGNNNNTNRSSPNSVGSAFLVAIQTTVPPEKQQQSQLGSARSHHHFAPFTEISSEEQGSVTESVSVSILSSVGSDDQLSPASTNRLIANQANNHSFKKPSWLERRKRSSVNTTTSSKANGTALVTPAPLSVPLRVAAGTTTTTTATCASSVHSEQTQSAILEKMVDERVRARVAELERRMEEQMHAFMQEMDAKVTFQMARLKERDSSTDGYPPNAHTHTEIDQSIDLP